MSTGPGAAGAAGRPFGLFDTHPRSAAVAAAVGVSVAGSIFLLSEASPSTAVFLRCLYALTAGPS